MHTQRFGTPATTFRYVSVASALSSVPYSQLSYSNTQCFVRRHDRPARVYTVGNDLIRRVAPLSQR